MSGDTKSKVEGKFSISRKAALEKKLPSVIPLDGVCDGGQPLQRGSEVVV